MLSLQIVEEERVYDLMDIFNAGIVHTTGAAGLRIQSAFKDCAENRGADGRPVKILTGTGQQQVNDLIAQAWDLDVLIGKQAAVDVGERCQIIVKIAVAPVGLLVEYTEQVNKRPTILGAVRLKIVMEHPAFAEDTGILGVKAEDQTHAQRVQALQRFFGFRFGILLQQRVIQYAHKLAGLQGNLHLLADVFIAGIDEEIQTGELLLQIGQQQYLRCVIGAVHVVDTELPEIAHHDPAGLLIGGQIAAVAPCLLIRGEERAVGLHLALIEIDLCAFLLDQNTGRANIAVDEFGGAAACFGVVNGDSLFKAYEFFGFGDIVDLLKQTEPERLSLLLFIAAVCPIGGKLFCGQTAFRIWHKRSTLLEITLFIYVYICLYFFCFEPVVELHNDMHREILPVH